MTHLIFEPLTIRHTHVACLLVWGSYSSLLPQVRGKKKNSEQKDDWKMDKKKSKWGWEQLLCAYCKFHGLLPLRFRNGMTDWCHARSTIGGKKKTSPQFWRSLLCPSHWSPFTVWAPTPARGFHHRWQKVLSLCNYNFYYECLCKKRFNSCAINNFKKEDTKKKSKST